MNDGLITIVAGGVLVVVSGCIGYLFGNKSKKKKPQILNPQILNPELKNKWDQYDSIYGTDANKSQSLIH